MKIAVISITENGRILSAKLAEILQEHSVKRYCYSSHSDKNSTAFEKLGEISEYLFKTSDAMIFVCACGIAVRTISPYIGSKLSDPAVIVIDDCGKFVIPILSGHIGGANRLAEIIAEKIRAVPVITTATDTGKKFSPDSLAKANELIITDMSAAKKIASAVLDDETIGIYSKYSVMNVPKQLTETKIGRYGIVIAEKIIPCEFENPLYLIPKNLVLGIGCRRGTSCESIEQNIFRWLENENINPERVKSVATIDLKKDEIGLAEFCQKYDYQLDFYSTEQLMRVEGDFTKSDFVKSITGVDNVCERSAVLASGGKLIMYKHSGNGVTCAVAETPVTIDFERKML